MRAAVLLILFLCVGPVQATDLEDRQWFGAESATTTLRVLSNTDTDIFAPIIQGFLRTRPDWRIDYAVASSSDIPQLIDACGDCFDMVVSSAMDLQLKLANDGLAQALPAIDQPEWAQWRQSLFGFTREPATIVLNRAAFDGQPLPTTRQALIEVLRAAPDRFRGKLGTYDVRLSGLGYLFATQDARTSEAFWRLMEVFGSLDARLYCCSGDMIDDLVRGDLAVAYNVLGSYAAARTRDDDAIMVITPDDFAITMMRTALVLRSSAQVVAATDLVEYLVSGNWAGDDPSRAPLPALREHNTPGPGAVTLEPGLLVHLDRLKRQLFLREWTAAMVR